MKAWTIFPLVFAAACFDASNTPECKVQCSSDSDCTDGLSCGAGGLCSSGQNCTEPETCTAGEFIACVDGKSRSCNATGDGTADTECGAPGCNATAQRCNACMPEAVACSTDNMTVEQCAVDGSATTVAETCAAGCNTGSATVDAHCTYISPAWLPNICDTPAAIDEYAPNASATITTTLDANCTGGVIAQPAGAPVCVVRAKTITIPNAISLTFNGTRPIAFVADTQLDVIGTLDVSADRTTPGPGGGLRSSGTASAAAAAGGGAGFGGAGAAGGSTSAGGGGAGGPAFDPITLSYFGGGARATTGTQIFDIVGGGGGGGLMLVACRGQVNVRGVIDAGGGGGNPSYDLVNGAGFQASKAAAGGGSGGYVVLQGLSVMVLGSIWANGGGGGGGNNADEGNSQPGDDGRRATTQAAGGAPGGAGAIGGKGGALGAAATVGGAVTNGAASGGGGGGVGVLQIYTPSGVTPATSTATTSPGFTAKKDSTLR